MDLLYNHDARYLSYDFCLSFTLIIKIKIGDTKSNRLFIFYIIYKFFLQKFPSFT